ncbi:MAG: PD40 domain-containing protein, partial [Blastocatellia bacterium]|nr:PD40 domain-containing protein [Blastocatellia bacterium]
MRINFTLIVLLCLLVPGAVITRLGQSKSSDELKDPRERHLTRIKQLTFDGENAEAYFSPDGKKLIFQRAAKGDGCDQIFSMNIDGSDMKMLSNGEGKTTCSYFTPDNKHIIYASTFKASAACPPKPDYSRGYVWSLFPGFDIFHADLDGSNVEPLTRSDRYDAEATIRKDGTIVFTSLRDGDL